MGRPGLVALMCAFMTCGLVVVAGCGGDADGPYVGDMDDRSYSGQVTSEGTVARESAAGGTVSITDFKGRFVWAEYAAPWCQVCGSQVPVVQSVLASMTEQVVFLTVMTSDGQNVHADATRATASGWAQRFGLAPDRVVAGKNLSSWTVPTHILYSPEGQTLLRHTGLLPADRLGPLLAARVADWKEWRKTGKKADWMR